MQNFMFENPTRIIFGKGSIAKIGAEVKRFGGRVLMVYGMSSIRTTGIYEQVLNSLKEAGVDIVELPGVKSNPLLSKAREGIELARAKKVDVILAVGGGSVIDTAKTIAAGAKADHDPWEFFVYTKLVKDALPVLVVLTLSASASEMNAAAVITKDETCQKFSVRSPLIQPKTSILDPEVLFTLTPAYTAYSAVDIITHMLEGYFTNTETGESPLQDRMIYAFMRTLMEATEKSLANPKDYDARANFMWSGTLAFNGLTTAGMGSRGIPRAHDRALAFGPLRHRPRRGPVHHASRLDGVVCEKEPGAIRTAGKGILPDCRGGRREGRRRGNRKAEKLVQRREEPRVPERRRDSRGRHREDRRQRRRARPDLEAEGLHERSDRGDPEPLQVKDEKGAHRPSESGRTGVSPVQCTKEKTSAAL